MGHWEQCPHTPGMEGHCLITLGGTQTPQRPHSALPTPCIRRFELRFGCHTVVWTPSSAARVAMGHGGNATTSQGWQDTAWSPSGAKHPQPQPHSALPTPYPTVSSYGSGVVRWCARHPQHVGSPWGIGGNATTSQRWQDTAWPPWGATHTPPQPHSVLPMHRIRPLVRIAQRRVRVSNGGVHVILSM
jgi:hypothetical protein